MFYFVLLAGFRGVCLIPVHVGLLGHIDHGKTELARSLSEYVSTAGLDRHPQARERGMTIDLGFTLSLIHI